MSPAISNLQKSADPHPRRCRASTFPIPSLRTANIRIGIHISKELAWFIVFPIIKPKLMAGVGRHASHLNLGSEIITLKN